MYEELVKRLRYENLTVLQMIDLMDEAADAIEELQKKYDGAVSDNKSLCRQIAELAKERNEAYSKGLLEGGIAQRAEDEKWMPKWIPVTEGTPSDFVSVQAHMTDAGQFPSVREAYTVDGLWFFPALKEFHPVDAWKRFDEPPKEE